MSDDQSQVAGAKFEVGTQGLDMRAALASVDHGLPELPEGYGESRIVLMPRDPRWAYAYWDIPNEHRASLRQQGGQQLALRFYDVTDIDFHHQAPHSLQQFDCDEMARSWYLQVPVSDRDYILEIGYLTHDGRWLTLSRSAPVHIPPAYPSDWINDQYLTLHWDEELRGRTVIRLNRFESPVATGIETETETPIHATIFAQTLGAADVMRVAGSLFGSMQQTPEMAMGAESFPSGAGLWTFPSVSGVPNVSGLTMSGAGLAAALPPSRSRKFWLLADAELIVYGATEPDALVTVADQVIQLSPDGTFRFQMSFQDGVIDYPIVAVAADGEQSRSIQMTFERETCDQNINSPEEAQEQWF